MIDYTYLELQNPWWEDKKAINNDLEIKELEKLPYQYRPKTVLDLPLRKGDVNIITGPRQTGKSTAIKLYIKSLLEKGFHSTGVLFFNCDVLSKHQDIIDLILEFIKRGENDNKAIFLDEISSVAQWSYAIKWLADGGFLRDATLFLTGSSSIQLKKSGELLPGRRGKGKDINFLPINFKEFLVLKGVDIKKKGFQTMVKIEKLFEEFLIWGGFLRNINVHPLENELYLATLKSDLYKARKKEDFLREVIRKLILSLSAQTSYTNIAEEAELGSKNTAIEYLSFLIDSFFFKEVKFFDISQKKIVLKKNKKYYTTDPYLIWLFTSFITGNVNFPRMEQRYSSPSEKGKLIENFIASELYKVGSDFYYFQNSSEIDFYLPKEKIGIEVKYKNRVTNDDLKPLTTKIIPNNVSKIIVTKNLFEKRGNIYLIPAQLITLSELWPKLS